MLSEAYSTSQTIRSIFGALIVLKQENNGFNLFRQVLNTYTISPLHAFTIYVISISIHLESPKHKWDSAKPPNGGDWSECPGKQRQNNERYKVTKTMLGNREQI